LQPPKKVETIDVERFGAVPFHHSGTSAQPR
jgi:hypothetical protein